MITDRETHLTDRQEKILNTIVREYIKKAEPVGSKLLEKKYCFGICPASIRIEMQRLTDKRFIFQPHTSAGRIPTDKGYRFFVDSLLELKEESLKDKFDSEIKVWLEKRIVNSIKFLQLITKNLSLISSSFTLGYLPEKKIIWKDGWEEIIKTPEFSERKIINDFFKTINTFERELEKSNKKKFKFWQKEKKQERTNLPLTIYIGKENPFAITRDFSIIISECHFPEKEYGIIALLGPKRMDYQKNILLMDSLIKMLEEL